MASCTTGTSAVNTAAGALTSAAFTTAAGDLLVAISISTAANSGNNQGGVFSDNGGLGWTNIITVKGQTNLATMTLAVANNFDVAQTTTRTVTWTPTATSNGSGFMVWRVSGMTRRGADAIRQIGTVDQVGVEANQAGGGTPAPTLPAAALTGNPTVGAVANAVSPAALTFPTSWTEDIDTGYSSPATGLEAVHRNSGFTGTTVTWGGASATDFCSMIAELDTTSQVVDEDQPVYGKIDDLFTPMVYS